MRTGADSALQSAPVDVVRGIRRKGGMALVIYDFDAKVLIISALSPHRMRLSLPHPSLFYF